MLSQEIALVLARSFIEAGGEDKDALKLSEPSVMRDAVRLSRGEAAVVAMVSLEGARLITASRSGGIDFMGQLKTFAPKWVSRADPEWIDSEDFKRLQSTGPEQFDIVDNIEPWFHPKEEITLTKIMDEVRAEDALHIHLGLADAPGIFAAGSYNFGQIFGEDTTLALLKSAFRLRRKQETDQYDWRVPVIYRDGPDLRIDIRWMGNMCLRGRHALGKFK